MNRSGARPFLLLLLLAWLVMMVLSFYASWLLLPDIMLLVLLATQLYRPAQINWLAVLPFALLADVAAAVPLGFHGMYYALVLFLLVPVGMIWKLVSTAAQFSLVVVIAAGVVLFKWLMTYILTGEPAASGWWLTVLGEVVCWPVVLWLVALVTPPEVRDEQV
ncbi:hypothetical protein KRX19_00345 [Cardiobacteriaceae bacterium TAE3-ERU3]|nr:hypothetical protein [Cardiobacteriaceae bacterium TAE3-ERU3]